MKKELGGCFLVFLGIIGLFIAITMAWTYWLLPAAFLLLIICLVMISYALGSADREKK